MNSNDAEIAAGEWLARLDRNDPSPQDLAALERWKRADPRHAAAYARLAATWQALDRVQAIRPSPDEPIDNDYLNVAVQRVPSMQQSPVLHSVQRSFPGQDSSDKSAAHFSSRFSYSSSPSIAYQAGAGDSVEYAVAEDSLEVPTPRPLSVPSQRRSSHRPWLFLSVAVSVLFAFTGLWIARSVGGPHTFSTSIGGFQRIVLEDQSAIELNTDSEVRVALTPQLRKVELVRGEASFEVAHDASRPFIVSAGNTAVRAVGTKFDVHRLENSIEVTVDEGKVAIGTPSLLEMKVDVLPITIPQITAGQTATASGNGVKLKTLPKDDLARKLAWQNQMLVFDGDSLADVVAQFNRYNARQLVIADPALATLRIGGYFRPTNLDAFISVLQSDFGIRAEKQGNRLVLATATAN
jgi:transmembrane sensor